MSEPAGINLLDYGCIRIFPPQFVRGVVDLYHGLLHDDDELVVRAYETWGFRRLSRELIDTLNIWARFIYAPLLDDRVRTIADGVAPAEYGRREAFRVHQALKKKGPVTVPREFVFMDRAAIGLGAVFLHLRAEVNFYRLFNEAMDLLDGAGGRAPAGSAFRRRVVGRARAQTESVRPIARHIGTSRVVIPDCRESGKSGIHSHRSSGTGAENLKSSASIGNIDSGFAAYSRAPDDDL